MISHMWSMEVVLFVLLNTKMPFNDIDLQKMIAIQLQKKYEFANQTFMKALRI